MNLRHETTKEMRKYRLEGCHPPSRLYGFAWHDCVRDAEVWYPMPLNWVFRWWRMFGPVWNRVQFQGA